MVDESGPANGITSRILVVEDDAAVRYVVEQALLAEGMGVEAVGGGEEARRRLESRQFDLAILDVMLPDADGTELCREITASSDILVMMLTVRDDETSVVVGLEVGADDYITKPFSPRELVSRVRAHLRRRRHQPQPSEQKLLRFPGLEIDLLRHRVEVEGRPVDLTAAQFEILALLAEHPGRVYSRAQLMESIWNGETGNPRSADMHVLNIRKEIEPDPKNPRYLQTVRGLGYKFAEF